LWKRRKQRERLSRRLLLAVRVIDQHLVEALDRLRDPRARSGDEKHGAPYTRSVRIGAIPGYPQHMRQSKRMPG
jgi:hypothetical protein